MASPLFTAGRYINYWLNAKGPHSLHSPLLFDIYTKAIKPASSQYISEIESIRQSLLQNDQAIDVIDFKSKQTTRRTIGSVAKTSLSKRKFSSFLKLLCDILGVKTALETGTSLGINALYLSHSNNMKNVVSLEGSDIIHQLAQKTIKSHSGIHLIAGDLYEIFESTLVQYQPELIFLDADHRKSAIDFCIEKIEQHCPEVKCIVIHDIYWSEDMAKAWEEIIANENFNLTIDLFQAGIIFPNHEMEKQHFTLRF